MPGSFAVRASLLALGGAMLLGVAGCGIAIGDACTNSYDCNKDSMTCDLSAPDGYCLKEGCWEDGDCPADGVCVTFPTGDRFCMRECDAGDDCRDGYSCISDLPGQPPFCYVR